MAPSPSQTSRAKVGIVVLVFVFVMFGSPGGGGGSLSSAPTVADSRKSPITTTSRDQDVVTGPLPSFGAIGEACVARPLINVSQCACLYQCVKSGFHLYHVTGGTRINMSPEHRVAVIFGPALQAVSKTWAEPGVVVDIGANDGEDVDQWWINFAGQTESEKAAKHFFLFEPQKTYLDRLEKQIATNERKYNGTMGYLYHGGVGTPAQHKKTLYLVGKSYTAQLVEGTDPRVVESIKVGNGKTDLPQIKMFSLEKSLADRGVGHHLISFLKIDTEGADATILHGSMDLFKAKRVQMGVMELHGVFVKRFPIQLPQVIEEVRGCGYRLFLMALTGSRPVLLEVRDGFFDYWPYTLETLIFVSESSGILEAAPFVANATHPPGATRHQVLNRWARVHYSSKRIYDCIDVAKETDIGDYCFPGFMAFPQMGGRPVGKRNPNLF